MGPIISPPSERRADPHEGEYHELLPPKAKKVNAQAPAGPQFSSGVNRLGRFNHGVGGRGWGCGKEVTDGGASLKSIG